MKGEIIPKLSMTQDKKMSWRKESRKTIGRTIVFLVAAALLSFLTSVQQVGAATDYFVSPAGNDSNPGSSSAPWKTIQKAANVMVAGDTCTVLAGTYDERIQITRSGTPSAPITYIASGKVTTKGFRIAASYVSVKGFEITNTGANWTEGVGIDVASGTNCVIENNYIYEATCRGIATSASTDSCTIRNNRLYRNGMVGIDLYGTNHLVEKNEIWGTIQHHPKWPDPPGADADGIRLFGSGHTFRANYIHDITYKDAENVDPHIDCFQTWTDAYHAPAKNIVFEGNRCVVLESLSSNANGHGFMLHGASYLTIRNNIIQAFGGVNTGAGGCSNLTIVNNVFSSDLSFPTDRSPIGIGLFNAPYVTIKNNIFYNLPDHLIYVSGTSSTGLDVGYNLAYRSDGKPPAGSPYPNDLWNVNPKFINPGSDFHLQADSPCIDKGISLSAVNTDFEGIPRPQGNGYDIGAYEKKEDVLPPPKGLKVLGAG